MEYVRLGNSDIQVSRFCLGCMSFGDPASKMHAWTLNTDESEKIIRHALDLGINFFDTANGYSAQPPEEGEDILVVYFSNTGNTERIAQIIADETGGTLWEIVPETPYTAADLNYSDSDCRANREQNDPDARPAIADEVENFEEYDRVFIGHPIWWGDAPRIIQTFLESYPFADKRVYTFSTSGSSSGNGAYNGLREGYPEINFAGNLHFTSSRLSSAQTRVADWLSEILSAEAA